MLNFIHLWGFVEESKSSSADITSSYKRGCIIKTTAGLQANILLLMKNASYVYFVREEIVQIKTFAVVSEKCDYFVLKSVKINREVFQRH